MATLNLGRIKPVFRGAYAGGTAYVIDDIVTSGGETFICIQASTGNATSSASHWTKLAEKGLDGTNVATTITTQGDILYRDGSGLQRLGAGTSGQYLETKGTGQNPVWSTVSAGEYSVHKIDSYNFQTNYATSSNTQYIDIAGGNTVSFQPTSTNDKIYISHTCAVYLNNSNSGCDAFMMMKENSASIGSSDIRLNYDGDHAFYIGNSGWYGVISKAFVLPCTGLNTSSTYYLEQAGVNHTSTTTQMNHTSSNGTGSYKTHNVTLIHYKKN